MAIKPSDCVIRIADLIIGQEPIRDMFGHPAKRDVYAPHWANFMRNVKEKAKTRKTDSRWRDPVQLVLEEELARFGAVYKQTKNWDNQYIKFKSHKQLTMFVLKWS